MAALKGVIETSSGDLLRAGFCTFSTDGAFNAGTETERTDIPFPPKVKGDEDETNMHRWNGSSWIEVAQP